MTINILKPGTEDVAPIIEISGLIPDWCGKKITELSAEDVDHLIAGVCMEQAAACGHVAHGHHLENPFNQRFLGGVPAMTFETFFKRGSGDMSAMLFGQ